MVRPVALAVLGALTGLAACSHDWDDYDPRLGGSGAGDAGVSTSATGSPTSSSGTPTSSGETSSTDAGPSTSDGTSTTSDGGAGPGSGPAVSSSDATTSTGSGSQTLEIPTDEADCVDPDFPDPDDCDDSAATDAFSVDAEEQPFGEWIGYLRFSPGSELAGKTVDAVSLRLFVSQEKRANSDDSGEVWETEPFDRASLEDAAPDFVGSAPVAPAQGAVGLGDEVTFSLSGLTVAADTPVYLLIVSNSIDGVDYLDERSDTPPTLIVTYH